MSDSIEVSGRRAGWWTLAILLLLSTRIVSAQETHSTSWIVYVDETLEVKEALESISGSLPEGSGLLQFHSVIPPETTPRAASVVAERLARYYVIEISGSAAAPSSDIPGLTFYPNHRYSVERHDGEDLHDPFIEDQWGLSAIRASRAWETTRGVESVVIAYIDTGIELDHPELAPNLYINPSEDINSNGRFDYWDVSEVRDGVTGDLDGIDQDGNGFIDDVSGFDFVDQVTANLGDWSGRDGVARDEQGHGTQVAGVGSARGGNNRGISGVAPLCSILPLRAFDATGDGEDDDIAAAIVYAADRGVDVINMSFGDYYRSPLLADAVRYAADRGVLMVASSGNDGIDDPHYPSGFSEVMSIGAMRRDSLLSFFSGYGSHISLVAPGEEILTTGLQGGYRTVDGTSFSAPHVSGVAALIRSLRPEMSAREIRFAIEFAATDLGESGWDIDFGAGLLDAYRSLGAPPGGTISIESPANDSGIVPGEIVAVTGTVIGVGLSSWNLSWGTGLTPTEWTQIAEGTRGELSSSLGSLKSNELPSGYISLSLGARFTDGTSIERRINLWVDATPPVVSNLNVKPIWVGNEEGYFVTCSTDDPTRSVLSLEASDGSSVDIAPEEGRTGLTRNHYWIVRPSELSDLRFDEIAVRATNPAGLESVSGRIDLPDRSRGAPGSTFDSELALSYGYIYSPDSFESDDRRFLLLNRFDNLTFSRTVLYRIDASGPIAIDSLGNFVPRGIGDTDGDGLLEALLQATGRGIVREQSDPEGTLFASTLYVDTTSGRFYPGAFIDVDRDGRDEVIGYTSDPESGEERIAVWRIEQGKRTEISSAPNPTQFPKLAQKNSFGASDVVHGDVDRNGYPEILVGDSDGDVLLFSWVPEEGLVLRWFAENTGVDADKVFAIADLEGDGRPEVIYGFQPEPGRNDLNEYEAPVWTLKGVSFDNEWNPTTLFDERFAWPRPVGTFRSGVDAGGLDRRPGDELVLVLFPNAWVFTWDALERRLRPIWSRSGSMMNDPSVSVDLVEGKTGFWVGDGISATYYTIDSAAEEGPIPPVLSGWSMSDSTVMIRWSDAAGADSFRVYREDPEGEPGRFELIGEVTGNGFLDIGTDLDGGRLVSGARYRYLVIAISDDRTSLPSNVIEVLPHAQMRPVTVTGVSPRQFLVTFSRKLPERLIRIGAIDLRREGGESVEISTVVAAGDSTILVTLLEPAPGELLAVRGSAVLRDRSGAPVDTSVVLSFRMEEEGLPASFWVTGAAPGEGKEVILSFSEPVDPESLPGAVFTIDPPGTIIGAEPVPGNDTLVRLELDPDYPLGPFGYTYTIRSSFVRSVGGDELPDGPGSIAGFTISAESLDRLEVFPQPFSYSRDERLTFRGLPLDGRIEIFTVSGRILTNVPILRGDGAAEWTGLYSEGERLPTGVYLYRVVWTDMEGAILETELKKLVLVE